MNTVTPTQGQDFTKWDTMRMGWLDAQAGEPLFPTAANAYAVGWSYFHGIKNPNMEPKK